MKMKKVVLSVIMISSLSVITSFAFWEEIPQAWNLVIQGEEFDKPVEDVTEQDLPLEKDNDVLDDSVVNQAEEWKVEQVKVQEAEVDPEPEPKSEPELKPKLEPKPEPEPKSELEQEPKQESEPTPEPDPISKLKDPSSFTISPVDPSLIYHTTDSLNLRVGPSTDYDRITTLSAGAELTPIGKYNKWIKVSINGNEGFVHGDYIGIKEEKPEPVKDHRPKYQPMSFTFNGPNAKTLKYKNGGRDKGQHIIDTSQYVSTWGGEAHFVGGNGKNTHFIQHNPGVFAGVQHANTFIVTDEYGKNHVYKKTKKYIMNDKGVDQDTGQRLFPRIVGTKGNRIMVQTCIAENDFNYLIIAEYVETY